MKNVIIILSIAMFSTFAKSQCWKTGSAGGSYSQAIKLDGTLWGWGWNYWGQIGDSNSVGYIKDHPIKIGNESNWSNVTCGGAHSLASKTDGTLWGWGWNISGQVGNDTTLDCHFPVQIGTDSTWKFITANEKGSFGIKSDGSLWSWGDNTYFQLGYSSWPQIVLKPKLVDSSFNWKSVSSGIKHSLGLKTDGTLWVWGYGFSGELGTGIAIDAYTSPFQLGIDSDWNFIAAGSEISFAIKNNGSLWGWGRNLYGRLGIGSTVDQYSPIQIGSAFDWKAIAARWNHVLGMKQDGSVWAWGVNHSGQLGDGSLVDTYIPVQSSLSSADNIFIGNNHSMALMPNQDIFVFGDNYFGQLGDDTTSDKSLPEKVNCTPLLVSNQDQPNQKFKIYPIPTSDKLNVDLDSESSNTSLTITSITGEVLMYIRKLKNHNEFSLNFSNGIYLIRIVQNDEVYQIKFVKR